MRRSLCVVLPNRAAALSWLRERRVNYSDIFEQLGATHLAVTTLLELAKSMLQLARPHDAVQTYQKALDLNKAQNGTRERLVILRLLAEAYIQAGCLVDAVNTYEETFMLAGFYKTPPAKIIGWYRELARKCEVRQLLILLITKPTARKMSPYHGQMMEYYKKENLAEKAEGVEFVSFLEPVELLRMKDFVLAVERKDLRRTVESSEKVYQYLDDVESKFVDYLVDSVPNPSGY